MPYQLSNPGYATVEKVCDEKFLGSDVSTGSKTIGRENGEMIVKFLKDPDSDKYPAKFKHWVKIKRKFRLMSYPPLGLVDVLCLPATRYAVV